jgi:AcrR family transcriptional regulator
MAEGSTTTRADRKRAELRAEIVDAAFAEFAERGYHQTGIADIARRVGIGHGTAYLHFKNKRDIVDHVVDELVGRVMETLAAENSPEAATTLAEYREQSMRIARALGEILMDDPRATRMLLLEATSVDAEMTERFGEAVVALLVEGAAK